MTLKRRLNGLKPCINAFLGLIVLVDIVKSKTYEFSIYNCIAVIESITLCRYSFENMGTTLFGSIIKFLHSATEGIRIRLSIATTEKSDRLAGKTC